MSMGWMQKKKVSGVVVHSCTLAQFTEYLSPSYLFIVHRAIYVLLYSPLSRHSHLKLHTYYASLYTCTFTFYILYCICVHFLLLNFVNIIAFEWYFICSFYVIIYEYIFLWHTLMNNHGKAYMRIYIDRFELIIISNW